MRSLSATILLIALMTSCDNADSDPCEDDPTLLECLQPELEVCDDGVDNDLDDLVDCLDFDCIDGPACVEPPLPPWTVFFVEARFGYDPVLDAAVNFIDENGLPQQIWLAFTLGTEEYVAAFDPQYKCTIVMRAPGPISRATWTADAGQYFAFEMPADSTFEDIDCNVGDHGYADAAALLGAATWGAALGPWGVAPDGTDVQQLLQTGVTAEFGQSVWDDTYAPVVVGAGIYWDAMAANPEIPNGLMRWNYAYGQQVDADMAPTGFNVSNADIDDGTPPEGIYNVGVLLGLNALGLYAR